MEEKKGRGGKREGAGRKAGRNDVGTVAFRVPKDIADILDRQESKKDYIINAIRFYEEKRSDRA